MGRQTPPRVSSRRPERARRNPGDVVAAVKPVAEELARGHGLVVWDVVFTREAGREMLRVACDRVGGVVADELALFADDLSRELDHSDAVPGDASYVLEVTSPGAERRLHGPEQFAVCAGRDVRVTVRDGRVIEGKIADSSARAVEITTDDGPVRVLHDDINRAQLVLRG